MINETDKEDLTSLAWLQSFQVLPSYNQLGGSQGSKCAKLVNRSSTRSSSPAERLLTLENMIDSEHSADFTTKRGKKKLLVHQRTNMHQLTEHHNQMLKRIDYANEPDGKPPYSYAALICLAMRGTNKKMTLSQIYEWIRENFAFYRGEDKSWEVRYNNFEQ